MNFKKNEIILPDNYIIYADYYYIVDGKITLSGITGRVIDLKKKIKAKEVRLCDQVQRGLRKAVR